MAARPLHVEELADILAFDLEVESTPVFRAERRSEDPLHTVLSTCSSLLAIVDVDDSRVVQFSHFTVKEYLTSARLAETKDTISRFHVSMTPAHTIVAQACLGALLHLDENITEDSLKDFPLAEYAAEHWVDHARFNGVSPNILDGMKRLFDPRKHHLSVWLWMYNPIFPEDPVSDSDRPEKAVLTPLHYAAICGLCDVAAFLIAERWHEISEAVDDDPTPLHLASEFGHADFVHFLLERGADTTIVDDMGFTPLCRASDEGHAEVARILLKRGSDIEINLNDFNMTPLQLALYKGHVEVARVLLAFGANKEVRDEMGSTPLHSASTSGQLAIVRMLLEHGADLESQDDRGFAPLHLASAKGQLAVVRILLEHGANPEARTPSGYTPLHFANEEIARFLVERDADANALGLDGGTPLHHGSKRGCIGASRILLEHGVGADALLVADNAAPLDLVPTSTYDWNMEVPVEVLHEHSPSYSCAGKRDSDSFHESDYRKRLRLDSVNVEIESEGSDVLMAVDS